MATVKHVTRSLYAGNHRKILLVCVIHVQIYNVSFVCVFRY